jgi:polysulfide reductase chain C
MVLHWGWLISIYLFLGGLGAGAYLVSFAAEKGFLGEASSLSRFGYYVSAPLVALGAGLLVFDLGQGLHKPWLIIGMFLNYRSVMTWGIYIVSGFIGLGLLQAYFVWTQKKAPKMLREAGAALAFSTCAYTGMLLAVVTAVPFWNFILMPVIFIVSAISTGLSITSILAYFFEKGELQEGKSCQAHMLLVGTEITLLTILFGSVLSGMKGPAAFASAQKIFSGSLAWAFWGILVVPGLVIPFAAYVYNLSKIHGAIRIPQIQISSVDEPIAADWDEVPIAAASVVEEGGKSPFTLHTSAHVAHAGHAGIDHRALCLCDGGVMVGGLALRCLIVFAAVPIWSGLLG